ncbi:elongation factor P [candidate division KSB1 bacterium]|nr:elongation factor P [candidate division KSB1 bacterium]
MPAISEFRRGMAILFKDDIYVITEYQHVKPGKGQAFIKTKLKNVKSGRVIDNTFKLSEKLEAVRLDGKQMQYLYEDPHGFVFMDMTTYDQVTLSSDLIGDDNKFLKEGLEVKVLFHGQVPITMELPTSVDYTVIEAEPAVKGDTAGNLTKMVTIETGAQIQVPPFINAGETIKIDTRNGSYLSRS